MDKNRLIMEFGCDARNEAVARVVVAAMLTRTNPTLSEVEDVKTAVSEAVTNSIIHGYGSGEGSIILEAYIEERTLYITITDHGCGIENVDRAMEPLYTTVTAGSTDLHEMAAEELQSLAAQIAEAEQQLRILLLIIK